MIFTAKLARTALQLFGHADSFEMDVEWDELADVVSAFQELGCSVAVHPKKPRMRIAGPGRPSARPYATPAVQSEISDIAR